MARGGWLVVLFIICKPVMSALGNRNELISGCRHSKKFLLNTVLTWLVLVANLTCSKHHLSTTRHAPTPRLAFIVLFTWWFASQEAYLSVSSNKSSRYNPVPSVYFYYIHIYIYSFIKKPKLMQPPPASIIERSTPKNTLSGTLLVIKLIDYQKKSLAPIICQGLPTTVSS